MANSKISALTAATTPLAGTEVLPVVQSGVTKQVSIANLTAGRAVSALSLDLTSVSTALTLSGGAIGKGIAFAGGQFEVITYGTVPMGIGTSGSAAFNIYTASVQAVNIDTSQNIKFVAGNLIQGTAAKGINFTANSAAAGMTSQLLNWYEEGTWTPNQGAGLTVVGAFSSSGTYTRVGRQITVRGQVTGATSVAVTAAGVISNNLPYAASVTHAGSMFNDAVDVSGSVQITSSSVVAASVVSATPSITFTATYTV